MPTVARTFPATLDGTAINSSIAFAFHNTKRRRIFHKPARAADKVRLHGLIRAASASTAFQALGATAFIVSSDQSFMRRAAGQALADFAALKK
jgi:2-keto-3-deoxy-L-rhamnonate aldolase RhmA